MMSNNTFSPFAEPLIAANQNNPAFFQQLPQQNVRITLSPSAPAFVPRFPTPDMTFTQTCGDYNQGFTRFTQPHFHSSPVQPVNNCLRQNFHMPTDQSSQDSFAHSDTRNNQGSVRFQHPSQRGSYQFQRGIRNQGRGQRGMRSFHRGVQMQVPFQSACAGHHSEQFSNGSGRRSRRQQINIGDRQTRQDHGDLQYTVLANNRSNGIWTGESRDSSDRKVEVSITHRNMSGLNMDMHNGRTFSNSQNQQRNDSFGAREGRVNYRIKSGDAARSNIDRNSSGAQSAPPGRKRGTNSNLQSVGDNQTEEGKDRRVQMEDQLKQGCYECMVCCDNIRQEVAVWNCQMCYHVFHLRCIKQWVKSSKEAEDDIWRCPACQNLNSRPPNGYRCFCGKVRDPKFQPGETPHGCGEVCRRMGKEGCSHRCTLLCHPGPCPPCNAVVQRTCDCGAERKSMRCGQIIMFKCDKVCGKTLNCGQHQCQVVCHEGDCLPCEITQEQECFGKHQKRKVVCGSEKAIVLSHSCQQPCNKTLGCGNHVCEDPCHPGECGECPLLPEQVARCCCGQTPLADLTPVKPRTNCLDPLPTCDKTCNKAMACGPPGSPHVCCKKCHEGPCGQCDRVTTLTCVCGANQKDFPCRDLDKFTDAEPFKCEKRCNKKRLCGRHKCNELCCTREVHICEVVCGRPLSCNQHKCEQLCHRGNCRPCLQASFDELTCRCGAEVLYPPVPCGTKPPVCHRICTRQHNCDHPVRHSCHSDEACPPCTELVQKPCLGDHEVRKNVPCYVSEISCGKQCSKPLPCNQHRCIKTCHKGKCLSEEQNEQCTQPCLKKRKDCEHACGSPCHAGTASCPQTPCKAQIEVKCACGQRTAKVQCQAGNNMSAEIAQFQRLTVQTMASGSPGQEVDISQLTAQKKISLRQLECDSSCALLERNRRLAVALEIQNPEFDAKLSGPKYSDFLKESAKKNAAFIAKVEKNFADLVQSAKQSKQPSRSFPFPSMNRDQRRIVHELAEAYGCETQSYDYEPNKNVVATAFRNKCFLPSVTLSASLSRNKAPPPIPHHTKSAAAWGSDTQTTSLSKDKSKGKPEIDYFDFSPK